MSTSKRKGSRGFVLYFPIADEPSAPVDKGVCYSKVSSATINNDDHFNNDDHDDNQEAGPLINHEVEEPAPEACTSVVAQSWTSGGSAVERRTSGAPIEKPPGWTGPSGLEFLFEPDSAPKRTAGIKIGVTAIVEDDSTKNDAPPPRTMDRKKLSNKRKSGEEIKSIPKSPLGRSPPRCSPPAVEEE